jgi:hypothetical protein
MSTVARHPLDKPIVHVAFIAALFYVVFFQLPFVSFASHPVVQAVSLVIICFFAYTVWFMRTHSWRRNWN